MSVTETIERVGARLAELDDPELDEWIERWADDFDAAVEAEDEELCEDLADSLLVFERTVLSPPGDCITGEELIREMGFSDLLDET